MQAAFADPDIAAVIASIGGGGPAQGPRPPRCRGTRREPEAVLRLQRQHESASVPLEPRRRLVPRRRSDGAARRPGRCTRRRGNRSSARSSRATHTSSSLPRSIRTRRRTGPTRRTSGSSCRCHRPSSWSWHGPPTRVTGPRGAAAWRSSTSSSAPAGTCCPTTRMRAACSSSRRPRSSRRRPTSIACS